MSEATGKGNNPELWNKLLADLDEKLQLGLLDKLKRCKAYQFEGETLIIEAATDLDEQYLTKGVVWQQLAVLAQDATGVREIQLKARNS